MTCRYCEGVGVRRSQLASGTEMVRDAPRCAFADETFSAENWDCGAMNRLRDSVAAPVWAEDQWAGIVPIPGSGRFILLGWYKSRGRTEFAALLDEFEAYPLTIQDAYAVIDALPILTASK